MVGKPPKIISASLLSVEEATTFLTENERKYNGWWWLRSPGFTWNSAASVDYNGSVEYYGYFVEENDGLVRPALIIDPTPLCFKIGDRFMFGTKCFKIISDNLAFCMRDIGRCCFREDLTVEDVNVHERSCVKRVVDEWFERALSQQLTTKVTSVFD